MKIWKTFYFIVCFSVMCMFFYFFCNSRKSNDGSHPPKVSRLWRGYQSLVAIFEDNDDRFDISQCERIPQYKEDDVIVNNEIWQIVSDTKIYLYSAHLDSRIKEDSGKRKNYVRILGMSDGVNDKSLYCRIWYEDGTATISRISQAEIWIANWDYANTSQYYRPYLFSCRVRGKTLLPIAVSVVQNPCEKSTNVMMLESFGLDPFTKKKEFAVCLKPLNFNEDISFRLLEWIELQLLLGADIITTYVYDVHPNVSKILNHYRSLGKMNVRRHTLPGSDPNDPTLRSQFLQDNIWQKRRHEIVPYNDCLYRHIHSHKFVIILDIDEAIVPTMHYTWSELLHHVFQDHKDALLQYSSLSATNVYFFDEFGEYKDDSVPKYMHMLKHIYRSANFSAPGFAVKSFHSTNNTLAVFNHYTLIPLYPHIHRNALIGRHLAQLHHYRSTCPPLMDKECKTNFMKFYKKDVVLWKYKYLLVRNVKHTAQELDLI